MAVTAKSMKREENDIAEYLRTHCALDVAKGCAKGTGLAPIYRNACGARAKDTREQMIKALAAFYADTRNIMNIWNKLSLCERDFVSYIVRNGGIEYDPTTIDYAKKYNLPLKYEDRWGNMESIMSPYSTHLRFLHILTRNIPRTKTVLFFPSGQDMPPFIFDVLKEVVKPIEFVHKEYVPDKNNRIICRESRIGDFAALVSLAASERMKVKEGTYDITKAKLAKISEMIGFEEVCERDGLFCTPKVAKRNNDFKVAQPLFVLAANSGLLDIDENGFVLPGKKSSELLFLPGSKLIKRLFNDYCGENRIYELHYISHLRSQSEWWIKWHEFRKRIMALLRNCPIGKFVKFEDFDAYAKLSCGDCFKRLAEHTVMVKVNTHQHYSYYDHDPDWNECESSIIGLILSFLSALGMVDIAYAEEISSAADEENFYEDDFYRNVHRALFENSREEDCRIGIAGFRITKLGAWVLGMTDKYEAAETEGVLKDEGGLVVLPDYSVIISGFKCRVEQEVYFSGFLTRVSLDDNAAVYKLDFKSILRAYNIAVTPKDIKARLIKVSDKPLPDNVARSLDDWQMKVGRVKIRTVTVVETDDALLLEEIKHIKGMGDIVAGDLRHAAAIDGDKQKKVKALIEKNGWLVD